MDLKEHFSPRRVWLNIYDGGGLGTNVVVKKKSDRCKRQSLCGQRDHLKEKLECDIVPVTQDRIADLTSVCRTGQILTIYFTLL